MYCASHNGAGIDVVRARGIDLYLQPHPGVVVWRRTRWLGTWVFLTNSEPRGCVYMTLTGHRVGTTIFLAIGVALRHGHGTGLGLVGTQSFPLLHQPVLVPQVVLHVRLGKGEQAETGSLASMWLTSIRLFASTAGRGENQQQFVC